MLAVPIAASAQPGLECWWDGRGMRCPPGWVWRDHRPWQEPRQEYREEHWRERHQEEWWNRREWCRRHPERCY